MAKGLEKLLSLLDYTALVRMPWVGLDFIDNDK
jgi:hypothetical protein